MDGILSTAPEIADALADKRPVVALESTIVAHGMPYPRNLETAKALSGYACVAACMVA